jgi:hypothetical protein
MRFYSANAMLEMEVCDGHEVMQGESGDSGDLIPRDYQQELLEKAIRQNVCSVCTPRVYACACLQPVGLMVRSIRNFALGLVMPSCVQLLNSPCIMMLEPREGCC